MMNAARSKLDENHFSPLITHSSPSRTARGREQRRIGSALRLGHRVARRDPAFEQRFQELPPSAPRCRSGRGSRRCPSPGAWQPKTLGAKADRPRISFMYGELDLPVALAAELRREVARPQPLLAHPLLQRPDHRVVHRVGLVVDDLLGAERRSSGSISSATKSRIQSSCASKLRLDVEARHAKFPPLPIGCVAGARWHLDRGAWPRGACATGGRWRSRGLRRSRLWPLATSGCNRSSRGLTWRSPWLRSRRFADEVRVSAPMRTRR